MGVDTEKKTGDSLVGAVLLADPSLDESPFRRSVIFLSAHSESGGALGVVMNRPTGQTLREVFPQEAWEELGPVEVFHGGPVAPDRMILTAWKWGGGGDGPKVYFGLTREQAGELLEEPEPVLLRAFLGYAGWSPRQLEQEIASRSWLVQPMSPEVIAGDEGEGLWSRLIPPASLRQPWEDWLERPDHPELN